jgi:pyruvate/2-oxoglutarate dehydrogenase complex dihydrolipoamide dehydrogenase (E3) component
LGGNFRLAAIPPKRTDIRKGIRFFENEIRRLNIQVRLGEEATLESIEHYNPDEIILATGATPIRPEVQGGKQENLVSAEETLLGKKTLGKRVLIIGGGLVGSEVADFLSEKGKEVILVEMLSDIALSRDRPSTFFIRQRLQQRGVRILLCSKVLRISGDEVIVEEAGKGKPIRPVDSIVYAVGYEPHTDLMDRLRLSSFRVHVVGDALKPRDALSAILEGTKIAREI